MSTHCDYPGCQAWTQTVAVDAPYGSIPGWTWTQNDRGRRDWCPTHLEAYKSLPTDTEQRLARVEAQQDRLAEMHVDIGRILGTLSRWEEQLYFPFKHRSKK